MYKKLFFLFLLFFTLTSNAQVFINELDCDTPSVDDKEFIELKSSVPNFSLNGYVLVLFNGTGSLINLSYYVIDLNGFTTDENGLFVIGNQLVSPVPGKLLPDNIFQNGPDGVGLYSGSSSDFPINTMATTANLVDAIVYGTNDPNATALMSLLGVTMQWNESAGTGGSTANSLQRKPDGTFESKTPTPGVNNDGSGFVYNGITISTPSLQLNEGDTTTITFTTQTPVTSNLTFTFSMNNGTFTTADYTGNTTVVIPAGGNTFTTSITFVDDTLDEGDELAEIKIGVLPFGYNRRNDYIQIRVIDNDFEVLPFGTPRNPTFGNVSTSAPAGYYSSLEGLSGAALKQALQNIIADPNVVHAHTYGDIIDILKKADQNPANGNQVWLMYVEIPRAKLDYQTGSSSIGKWNREHIYPQSRGGFSGGTSDFADGIDVWLPTGPDDILAGHADAHHIRAEDGPENSSRSNKDYGLSDYNGPNGNFGSWKGDAARAVFYMAVRYNGLSVVPGNPADSTVGQLGDLTTLLQWNMTDPSDDFEMNRNNYIYTWQVNRNPFIDYPSLANYIWGANAGQPWFASLSTNQNNLTSLLMFPNPTKNSITISGVATTAKFEMFSLLGQKVFEQEVNGTTTLNFNLSKGIYVAKIILEGSETVRKLIIE
jgi:hypothetical protein